VTTQIAFLRAVNLGKRQVKMSRLVGVCEDLGYDDVWTHINSGNVVFGATGTRKALEDKLEDALEAEFGFECTTFVRTAAELAKTMKVEPFEPKSGDTYFVTFLKKPPSAKAKAEIEALSNDFETLLVKGRDVHWLMHGKSTDSKLVRKDWEKILGPLSSTSRNTTMLRKLVDKVAGSK
jgi:uncharacterized protein (DUF1697 family)